MVLKTIGISEYVKGKLDDLKRRYGHTSYDSVLRYLLILEKDKICVHERPSPEAVDDRKEE